MKRVLLSLSGLLWLSSALAETIENGKAICEDAERFIHDVGEIDGFPPSAQTYCMPTLGRDNALSFVILTNEPVFSSESLERTWLIAVVASLGRALNDRPAVDVDQLTVSDASSISTGITYTLPVALTRSLQRRIFTNQIDLDKMYDEIQQSLAVRKPR
jgi:hypothetical protein